MPRIQFTKDIAGVLEFYAPEGVPDSAATLTIYTSASGELEGESWPATVTLSTATTTTTATANIHTDSLTVADESNFVVDERAMINFEGQRLEVVVRAKSSLTLELDQELSSTIVSGATVASHRLTYALTAAQNATLRRRLRAVWSYEVDSVPRTHQQYFSVVREPFNIALTEEDIESHDFAFGEYADRRGAWKKLIHGSHNDVERMLRALQLSPDLVRDRDSLKDALIFSLLSKFYGSTPGQMERSEKWKSDCQQAVRDMSEARTWYDVDDDHDAGADGVSTSEGHGGAIVGADGISRTYYDDCRFSYSHSELGPPVKYMPVG